MAKKLLILFILLLCNEVKAASFNTTYQTDTTAKPIVFIPQSDSLFVQDSLRLLKLDAQSIKKKRTLKIIGGSLAAVLSVLCLNDNAVLALLFGLLSIGLFVSTRLKKNANSYPELQEEEEIRIRKKQKDIRWNNAWSYSLLFGIIGMISTVIIFLFTTVTSALFLATVLPIIYFLSTLFAIFMFFVGFKGQYKSKKQRNRGILKGAIGIILPFFPYLLLLFLLITDVINWGE